MLGKVLGDTLSFIAAGLLLSGLTWAQEATLKIDDKGVVISADQTHHTKRGRKITWARQSGGGKSWYVEFAESPCVEGSKFGTGLGKVCTISPDAAFKSYKYSSALSSSGPLHDPDVVVDP